MADHLMMTMNHGQPGGGLHGYRMGMSSGHQQHAAAQQGMRAMPNGQMMHYGGQTQASMEAAMRQRQAMAPPGAMGSQMGHHQMNSGSMMYAQQQQQQQQQHPQQQHPQQHHMHPQQHPQQQQQQAQHAHPHAHPHHPQQPQQQQQQQFVNGGSGLTSQQLMASMQLQKLNTQYHGHPLGPPMGGGHMGGPGAQYRMSPAQLANMQHMAGPALALNGMDVDMIDEEVGTVREAVGGHVQDLKQLILELAEDLADAGSVCRRRAIHHRRVVHYSVPVMFRYRRSCSARFAASAFAILALMSRITAMPSISLSVLS